ncbi:unnamed protein product [Rangifer tarandus platyrhynchus]|uniref:Uncharacterized protein n=2 Tax=Rangifer tarandus platyrhynchus TaxID=3082113 RepID=A0ABN8ZEQ3_RANTA|nr:unnamed protein product [Rangifer tarandus platyrhynchus]
MCSGVPGVFALLSGDLLATWTGSTRGPNVECKGLLPRDPSGQALGPSPSSLPRPQSPTGSTGRGGGGGWPGSGVQSGSRPLQVPKLSLQGSPHVAHLPAKWHLLPGVLAVPHLQASPLPTPPPQRLKLRVPEGRSL